MERDKEKEQGGGRDWDREGLLLSGETERELV